MTIFGITKIANEGRRIWDKTFIPWKKAENSSHNNWKLTGYKECEKDPWHRRIDRAGMQCVQAFACTQRQTCPDQSGNLLPLVCSCGTNKKINIKLQWDIAKPRLEICSIWMLRFKSYTWNYFGTLNKFIFSLVVFKPIALTNAAIITNKINISIVIWQG